MKKIEEAASEYSKEWCLNDELHRKIFESGFIFGVNQFAQQWYNMNELKPTDIDLIFKQENGKCSVGRFVFIESKLCITTDIGYTLLEDSLFKYFRPIELK